MTKNTKDHDAVYGPLSLDIEEDTKRKSSDSIVLYLTAISACLLTAGVGYHSVWLSPLVWKLKSDDSDINPLGEPISTIQVALIAGLPHMAGIISPIGLSNLCDIIGRRKMLILLSVMMLAGNIFLAFSTSVYLYYISRVIIGISMGACVPVVSVFLCEISENHNRGLIGCFIGMSFPLGNLYAYILGPLFSVKNFTLLCSIPTIVNLLSLITFIPESPFFLASKGERKEAIITLEKIRNKNPSEIEKEYESIIQTLEETSGSEKPSWSILLSVKSLRKGLIIAIGMSAFQELTGIIAVLTFAGPLFDAAGSSISGDMTAILIGIVKLSSAVLTTSVIERTGRRPLLIASTLGGCIPLISLGLFFYLKNIKSPLVQQVMWLPIPSVLVYITTYSLGLGVIPTSMMSELFPSNVKARTASACTTCAILSAFLVTTVFPIMMDFLGPSWCLWTFSFFSFLGFLFTYIFVPEIKGKSLTEVQEMLAQ